jgi:uncharacterized protein (DUF1501 family)
MSDDNFPFPAYIGTVGTIAVTVTGEGHIEAHQKTRLFSIGPLQAAELASTLLAAAQRAPDLKAAYNEALATRDRAVEQLHLEVETILARPDTEES